MKKGVICVSFVILLIAFVVALTNDNFMVAVDDLENETDILMLVNRNNRLPDGFSANLTTFEDMLIDEVVVVDLREMWSAAAEDNVQLHMTSTYRDLAEQEQIFNNSVANFVSQGNSQSVAIERAKQIVACPGYSEHHTGLAIDFSINDMERQVEMWSWLRRNAHRYGFILRYPEGKEHITGFSYEPWHFRYVGRQHAKTMYENGFVLEEYLEFLRSLISRPCKWE